MDAQTTKTEMYTEARRQEIPECPAYVYDFEVEMTQDDINERDMACMRAGAETDEIQAAWYNTPAEERPRLFAEFAGF